MATGAIVARIVAQYSGAGVRVAKRDLMSLSKDFDRFAKMAVKTFAVAGIAATAFAVKVGIDGVKAALADNESQVLLANSVRNTTKARESDIVALETWIDRTQIAYGVLENDLRPAMSKLLGLTHNVTDAQSLLGISMDTSAGSGRDLNTVTNAIMRASAGNLAGFTRLGILLPKNIVKTKNFGAALEYLSKRYDGAAAAKANTFGMKIVRMGIAFDELKEKLGYALIPMLTKFFNQFLTKIPMIQAWLDKNSATIVGWFKTAITNVINFGKVVFSVFSFVARNSQVFIRLGTIIAGIWAAGKAMAFIITLGKIAAAFKVIRAAAAGAGLMTAIATGGISVAAAAAGAIAFAAAVAGTFYISKKITEQMDKQDKATKGLTLDTIKTTKGAADYNKMIKSLNLGLDLSTTKTTKLTKAQVASLAAIKALSKFGVKPNANNKLSDLDPVQIEAVRLNLVKQEHLAKREAAQAALEALALQLQTNVAIQRYSDILTALADNRISTEEVSVLALKWGVTSVGVLEYVSRIYAANATPVSNDAVLTLLTSWGLTRDEAQKYISFAVALSDQKLSDAEIANLKAKWGMTVTEVKAYAKTVEDGTVFSTTWADPANLAKDGWNSALAALNAYNSALTGRSVTVIPPLPSLPPILKPDGSLTPRGKHNIPTSSASFGSTDISSLFLGDGAGGSSGAGSGQGGTNVTVNVQGSVTTASDLAAVIRDQLLTAQTSGKRINIPSDF